MPLLDIQGLRTSFFTARGPVPILEGLDLRVNPQEILGLVGESGSGKSVTAASIMRLLKPPGRVLGGRMLFDGRDLLTLTEREMDDVRGLKIAMIFQNPRSCLNPLLPIGRQLRNVLRRRPDTPPGRVPGLAPALLSDVGLPDPDRVLAAYPHELSGGMCQRVMIALALACSPRLLIADEPTTGLDVTVQQQIIALLRRLAERNRMAQIIISHDLGLVAEVCDAVAVMYAGRIVEYGPVIDIFDRPQHPYTRALLDCRPRMGAALRSIRGTIPNFAERPPGCPFHPRCDRARSICAAEIPPSSEAGGHAVACYFPGEA